MIISLFVNVMYNIYIVVFFYVLQNQERRFKMDEKNQKIIVYVMQSIFSVIGIIGNFLVLYIYFRKKDKLILSIFILVLVGVDFFMCFVIVFFNIVILYLDYKYGYDLMCWLYMFLIIGGVLFVIFIMVVIVFDRYFCICYFFFYVIIIF